MLELVKINKSFGQVEAVRGVSLKLARGQFLSLLGPSGCGKTTTLRMIAGFEQPSSGQVYLAGRDLTHVPARRRNIGMVFQSYALFPHLTAAENIAFGLAMRRSPISCFSTSRFPLSTSSCAKRCATKFIAS
jgi:ABC-type Fe3+/spermidine/putrescine transport system ATPase subunit